MTDGTSPGDAGAHPRPRRSRLAAAALALALACALGAALSGFGTQWDWWTFRTGFSVLRWSVYGAMLASALAAAALVRTLSSRRGGRAMSALALVLAVPVIVVPLRAQRQARSLPPIHDITTDTENPPRFVAVAPLRAGAPNPIEYEGPEIAAQQRAAYPDVQPLRLEVPPPEAFDRALRAAREMGWEIVAADPAAGRIEATARTFWFGFEDDVVVRLTRSGGGTIVDVRSVSRVGKGDVGANARRIRKYLGLVRG